MRKPKRARTTPLTVVQALADLVTVGATIALVAAVLGENDPATMVCAHIFTSAVLVSLILFVLRWMGRALLGAAKAGQR
jgi:hypothetical protein